MSNLSPRENQRYWYVVVYKLVQHFAHTYTVKLYSDMFWRWPQPSSGKTKPPTKTTMHTSLYFTSPFNTQLFISHLPLMYYDWLYYWYSSWWWWPPTKHVRI